jgi:hypothetical protein
MATDKQVNYALLLMRQAGIPTDWMSSAHKRLGASMRERTGRVEDWLRSLDVGRASEVIDTLKSMVDR